MEQSGIARNECGKKFVRRHLLVQDGQFPMIPACKPFLPGFRILVNKPDHFIDSIDAVNVLMFSKELCSLRESALKVKIIGIEKGNSIVPSAHYSNIAACPVATVAAAGVASQPHLVVGCVMFLTNTRSPIGRTVFNKDHRSRFSLAQGGLSGRSDILLCSTPVQLRKRSFWKRTSHPVNSLFAFHRYNNFDIYTLSPRRKLCAEKIESLIHSLGRAYFPTNRVGLLVERCRTYHFMLKKGNLRASWELQY